MPKFCELEVEYDCVGGGRINHKKDEKSILVYGFSMVNKKILHVGIVTCSDRVLVGQTIA